MNCHSKGSEQYTHACTHARTHAHLTALCPGLPRWAGTRMVKPIWILLKQETVSGSDISWAICKSARHSRQITTPATHHSVFYRPDALPIAQPTASKHWRQVLNSIVRIFYFELYYTLYSGKNISDATVPEACGPSGMPDLYGHHWCCWQLAVVLSAQVDTARHTAYSCCSSIDCNSLEQCGVAAS